MKKIITVFGILLLIFLIGCKGEDEKPGKSPFIGGSQGIVSEFQIMGLEEEGVETVFENEEFDVIVTLKNKGEADVETGKATVIIKGVDTSLFNIVDPTKSNSAKLEKVDEYNTQGGEEDINFGKAKLEKIEAGSYYDATFFANVEYLYSTVIAVPKVCFKYDLTDKTICDVEGTKTAYPSSAPVQVRSVKEAPAGNKRIALTFEIENVGGGRITLPDNEFLTRYDRVKFTLSESDDWDCKAGGSANEARFTENRAALRCVSQPLPENTLYTKQVTLTLDYLYRDTIQKTVRIKELANE